MTTKEIYRQNIMIHWFPGHMHKATKELKKIIGQIDIAIEVVDARCPDASSNPTLNEIAQGKPIIKILSKIDLADPKVTQEWMQYFQGKAIALNTLQDKQSVNKIVTLARKLAPNRGTMLKPIRMVVFGIPNVGKSTLINALAKRKIAKTGNEPAVTKQQQKILLDKGVFVMDTPGIMFPSPKSDTCGYKLGAIGCIRDTAMDYPLTAHYLIEFLTQSYPSILHSRYGCNDIPLDDVETALEVIGKTLGQYSVHQVAEKMVLDFRTTRMGKLSLETPQSVADEKKRLAEMAVEKDEELPQ